METSEQLFNKLVVNRQDVERMLLIEAHTNDIISKMMQESISSKYLDADFDNKTDRLTLVIERHFYKYSVNSEDIKLIKGGVYLYLLHELLGSCSDGH